MRVSGAIPERVVVAYEDALGNPVDVSAVNALPTTGGGGGGTSQVEIVDENGNPINAVNPFPVTNVNHEDIVLLMTRILNYLNSPQGYDKSLQRQRGTVVVESGTVSAVTTVTTVTTVSGVANVSTIDTLQGRIQVHGANLSAWRSCVRACIT